MARRQTGFPVSSQMDSARSSTIERILERLLETPGIQGVRLIRKDGGLIRSVGVEHGDPASFTVIAATLIGSGDFLFDDAGQPGDVRVTLKTDHTRIHLAGVTEDYLLATLADNRRDWASLRIQVNQARASLRAVLDAPAGPSA